ncbi:FAS1 domain-containing protein [Talaromyces proteolyticus]|uniref:FAS1 domain-containing protein n=1 Tax=Talaromyces proteolyticus TaxID=1131652 RepID=A0AAD4PWJ6_9EURO|nr:FAS1 domain-containing protein [Talaromyces proteolyticus]KAH8695155.1 FAS1 domain-containing protein [Talaromyces proteolyticus]
MSSLKIKRVVFKASRALAVIFTVTVVVPVYLASWQDTTQKPIGTPKVAQTVDTTPKIVNDVDQSTSDPPQSRTVWGLLQDDSRISTFAHWVGQFDDIVGGLDTPQARFTLFAPTNEAFAQESFEHGLPWFYWKFLVGYHMGPGNSSAAALRTQNTVQSFVNADIFFKYKQRISVQTVDPGHDGDDDEKEITLNRHSTVIVPDQKAINGYVHLVDRVLFLPESTTHILRSHDEFATFREALTKTVDLAVLVNDTSTHIGQTIFAPTEAAFAKLGRKANQFFFGTGGEDYLRALLAYHIVANQTLFSDVYFQEDGRGQLPVDTDSQIVLPSLITDQGLNITVQPAKGPGHRQSVQVNSRVPLAIPDLVAMDGVVHGIDTILVPPAVDSDKDQDDESSGSQNRPWLSRFFDWSAGTAEETLTVDQWIERLQPLVGELRV